MRNPVPAPEALEPRIAPAAVFTYLDVDGDKVTVHSNKGNSSDLQNIFQHHAVFQNLGYRINEVDFTFVPAANIGEFSGANITISVARGPHGDGHVDLGTITAGTMPLGSFIAPKASIQAIDCGNGIQGIGKLVIGSYGTAAPAYFNSGIADALGQINGAAGTIHITGDIAYGGLEVGTSGTPVVIPTVTSIYIGGNLNGAVTGATAHAGELIVQESQVLSITIKGSVIGGTISEGSGSVDSGAFLVRDEGRVDSLVIGGSIVGGSGVESGRVSFMGGAFSLGGLIIGGSNTGAGILEGSTKTVTVKGDVIGGVTAGVTTEAAGGIDLVNVQTLLLKGNLIAGKISGGDMNTNGSIVVADSVNSIHIGGSVIGSNADRALILVDGSAPATVANFNAIASLTIGGSFEYGVIASGHDESDITVSDLGNATVPNAGIGSVTVGGDFYHSSILAGTNDHDSTGAGRIVGGVNEDTQSIGTAGELATLGPVVIKGALLDDLDSTADSGFEAAVIKSITVGGNIVFQHGQGLTYFDPNDFVFADEITPT